MLVARSEDKLQALALQIDLEQVALLDQMKAQVPAFISFLQNRTLATQKESRMWFHPALIKTETFEEVVTVNEPSDATELR